MIDDMLALDADWMLEDTVVYIVGDQADEIPALIRYLPEMESVPTDDGERKYKLATVLVKAADVTDPSEGHFVEIAGERWNVLGIEARMKNTLLRLNLRRSERTAVSGPDFRMQHNGG